MKDTFTPFILSPKSRLWYHVPTQNQHCISFAPSLVHQGLCWVMDDAFLREPGPKAEGITDTGAGCLPHPPEPAASTDPVTPALYVSPTSGQLSPGEESRIRLTFTPKRAGVLSFALPVWLARMPAKGTRPYLTLNVKVNSWFCFCWRVSAVDEKKRAGCQLCAFFSVCWVLRGNIEHCGFLWCGSSVKVLSMRQFTCGSP